MQQYRHSGLLAPRGLHLSHGQQTPLPLRNQTPETLRPSKELLSFSPSELGERRVTRLIHQCLVAIWPPKRASPLYGLLSRHTPKAEISPLAVGKKYQGTSLVPLDAPQRLMVTPTSQDESSAKEGPQDLYLLSSHLSLLVGSQDTLLSLPPCASCHPVIISSLSTSMIFTIGSHLSGVAIFFLNQTSQWGQKNKW